MFFLNINQAKYIKFWSQSGLSRLKVVHDYVMAWASVKLSGNFQLLKPKQS